MCQEKSIPTKIPALILCLCLVPVLFFLQSFLLSDSASVSAATLNIQYETGPPLSLDNRNIQVMGHGWAGEDLDPNDITLYSYQSLEPIDATHIKDTPHLSIAGDEITGYITIPDELMFIQTNQVAIGFHHQILGIEVRSDEYLDAHFPPFDFDPPTSHLPQNASTILNFFDFVISALRQGFGNAGAHQYLRF